jgi:ribosomal protein S18 acetylase RimI-like enzyme
MGSIEEAVDIPASQPEPGIAVRDAQASELDDVTELLGEVYGVYRDHFAAEDAWRSYIGEIVDVRSRLDESELIVAARRGVLVGTIGFYGEASRSAIEQWPVGWASIRTLAVRRLARRDGIGEALARECLRRARERDVRSIGVHTAAHLAEATRLYERIGFRRASEFDVDIGEMFSGCPLPLGETWTAQAYRIDLKEDS